MARSRPRLRPGVETLEDRLVLALNGVGLPFGVLEDIPAVGDVAAFFGTSPITAFTATIQWGDGSPNTILTSIDNPNGRIVEVGPNLFKVNAAHTYNTAGSPSLTVTITDGTDTVTVAPFAPVAGLSDFFRGEGSALNSARPATVALVGSVGFTAGQVGQAFQFGGGEGSYVNVGPKVLGTDPFTLSFWLQTTSTARHAVLGDRTVDSSGTYLALRMNNGLLSAELNDAADNYIPLDTTVNLSDGIPHHVAIVRDGPAAAIYIDGVLRQSGTSAAGGTTDLNNGEDFLLGAEIFNFAPPFRGLLDEVAFLGRALTATEVQGYLSGGVAQPFRVDSVGGAPTLSINDVTVSEPDSGTVTATFTVSLSAPRGETVTVNYATADGTAQQPGDYVSNTGTLTFDPGQTSKTIMVLVNGDTLDEVNETFLVNLSSSVNATLADAQGQGTIADDDTAINAVGLAFAAQAGQPAVGGLALFSGTSPITAYSATVQWGDGTSSTLTSTPSPDGQIEAAGPNLFKVNAAHTYAAAGTPSLTVTITDTVTGDTTPGPVAPFAPVEGLSQLFRGEGSALNSARLATAALAGSVGFTAGQVGQAFQFGGSEGSYVNLGPLNLGTGPFSLSFWLRTTSTTRQVVLGDRVDGSHGTFLGMRLNDAGMLNVELDDNDVNYLPLDSTRALNDGSPHHVALVRDGGSVKLYLDGVLDLAGSTAAATDLGSGRDFLLGAEFFNFAPPFQGLLDEVAVFGRALTAAEVQGYFTGGVAQPFRVDGAGAPTLSINDVTVTEGNGGTVSATFTISLSAASGQTVSVSAATATATAVAPDDYAAVAPTIVTFAPGVTSQTFTVQVNGDLLDEPDETFLVNLSGASNATIADGQGSGTINDDDTAGITVSPVAGLVTTEAGGTATFTVRLDSQPTANVTITLSSSDTTEGTVAPASLTFTPANFATEQTVTITGVDDLEDDGDIAYTILTAPATSTDPLYNTLNAADVAVTNTDNDTAGITVTPVAGLTTTEAGGTATFTVRLDSQPTADITIALSSSDTTEGTVVPISLTFTPANFATPQIVTVTGVDDLEDDGDIAYTILTAPATSTDPLYNTLNAADVAVTNTDNDTARAQSTTTLSVSRNGTGPGQTVTVTARVTSSGSTPTGQVIFREGNTALGSAPLIFGLASLTRSELAVGVHTITAEYVGDPAVAPSTSGALRIDSASNVMTVTVSLTVDPPSPIAGQYTRLTATVTLTGPGNLPPGNVIFKDGATSLGSAPLNGARATFETSFSPGMHQITAEFGGFGNVAAATSNRLDFTANAPTSNQPRITVSLRAEPANPAPGQGSRFIATVSAEGTSRQPTGTVSFKNGPVGLQSPVSLIGGTAALDFFIPGQQTITAEYSGDSNFPRATSNQVTVIFRQFQFPAGPTAQKGYLAGATVFYDANSNGVLDAGEPQTVTAADGSFDLDTSANGSTGQLVVTGGTDTSTLLPNTTVLTAPADAEVVSPLTTLVNEVRKAAGLTTGEANTLVAQALGLPAGFDFTGTDLIQTALSGDAAAAEAFAAEVKIAGTVAQVDGLLGGSANESSAIFEQLAALLVAGAGAEVDLNNAAVVEALIEQSAVVTGVSLAAGVADGAAMVLAGANQHIDALPVSADAAYLTQVVRAQVVAEGANAAALAQVAAGQTDINAVVAQQTGDAFGLQAQQAVIGTLQPRVTTSVVTVPDFVARLLRDLLGSVTSSPTLESIRAQLLTGQIDRGQAVLLILASPEYRNAYVERLYATLFGRQPTDVERARALAQLKGPLRGAKGQQMLGLLPRLLSSREYYRRHGGTERSLLRALTHDLLGDGAAVPGGLRGQGLTRLELVQRFLVLERSSLRILRKQYEQFFGVPATPDVVKNMRHQLAMGRSRLEILVKLLAGSTYFALSGNTI